MFRRREGVRTKKEKKEESRREREWQRGDKKQQGTSLLCGRLGRVGNGVLQGTGKGPRYFAGLVAEMYLSRQGREEGLAQETGQRRTCKVRAPAAVLVELREKGGIRELGWAIVEIPMT